ncbi:ABC transporter ATP-binding protein [Mameliella alba]|uniref:ABC transporter ATP-binding protein n=1 Tax=Mameliella alba TaxID=561184 RepID=UPI000B530693|nr:ABC transporter ATP-binding protein [Mameliella alba]OWV39751.1 sugar ABC transporter ATP-binding protein [Mameliella alba]GGF86501.1 sugar ABC transporter ATP-binding protein [Mameliella alba]
MSTLSIKKLVKKFGQFEALKSIDLEVEQGEFVVFVGPSGCGKSTLLRSIAGLESITSGTIELADRLINDVEPSKRGLAMVFQTYALYPHMTVRDNMGYSLKLAKMSKSEIAEKVEAAAEKLQLSPYLDRKPFALSGGQRQRVAIGRAIVRNPKLFLFDEPLSNLDAALRVQMRLEIAQLSQMLPETTMIYVTHDQVEAMTMADRIVVLRDGAIEQVGTPLELFQSPANIFVAQFIGSPKMNIFGERFAKDFSAHSIGVRPEHLTVGDEGIWSGQVVRVEQLGSDAFIHVDIGQEEFVTVRHVGITQITLGANIRFTPQDGQVLRFDRAGKRLDEGQTSRT